MSVRSRCDWMRAKTFRKIYRIFGCCCCSLHSTFFLFLLVKHEKILRLQTSWQPMNCVCNMFFINWLLCMSNQYQLYHTWEHDYHFVYNVGFVLSESVFETVQVNCFTVRLVSNNEIKRCLFTFNTHKVNSVGLLFRSTIN